MLVRAKRDKWATGRRLDRIKYQVDLTRFIPPSSLNIAGYRKGGVLGSKDEQSKANHNVFVTLGNLAGFGDKDTSTRL